jgi:glycine cleavage system H lipoate-binding protein/ABC-type phosphate transport system substrate-binding protein
MKYLISLLFGMYLLCCSQTSFCTGTSGNKENTPSSASSGITLKIAVTPELRPLIMMWTREYGLLNPSVDFSVSTIGENQGKPAADICIVSDEYARITGEDVWRISLGHQAIVPVLNTENPLLPAIIEQGISTAEFAGLVSNPGFDWSDLISGGQNKPVTLYILANESVKTAVSAFTKVDPAALIAIPALSAEDLLSAIRKDPYAVGFCRLSDVKKEGHNELAENIRLLPVDKNGNGRLDPFESIFNTPDDFARGLWVGKYPHALTGNIYALSQAKPTDKNALAFLTWTTTDGGKYMVSNGYSDLISLEKQANLAILSGIPGNEVPVKAGTALGSLSWLIIIAMVVIIGTVFAFASLILSRRKSAVTEEGLNIPPVLNVNTIRSPYGLYYDRTHTWAYMETDGFVRVGIDDFLQHVTGSITRIMMREPGEFVRKGEKILTLIRDGKQLNLYAPLTGTIKALNTRLYQDASLINESPYENGWVYLLEPRNWLREIQFMFLGENYREWLKTELIRLRNFFTVSLRSHSTSFHYAILQDGGEMKDNVLADLDPEVWEDFQTRFIDTSR